MRSDYTTEIQGRTVVVPELERQECPDCGEVLFDCAAMARLESLRTGKPRAARSGKS
ncbi:MAG: YgiT-type zinc finger protein [Phycisphaerae bacterium]|nr:YgiT-type zinc finger protein [Phycisphaerae bacterium]